MNIDLTLLAIISVLTTLTTECIKKFMDKADVNYISNIIAAIVSVVLSIVIVIVRPIVFGETTFSAELIYKCVVMAFFGVLSACLSFDKVKQIIEKFKK